MTPTVSVIIPTFNQAPAYLRAALLSAKRQTYQCQIVVIDDGSEPRQDGIVEEVFAGEFGRYEVGGPIYRCIYDWQPNGGVARALNRAIELATGEWIEWLPSDDVFLPHKTAMQLAALQRDNGKVSYCAYEEGIPQIIQTVPAPQYPTQEAFFEALKQHCFINAACVMWHRSVLEEVSGFDPRLRHAQDYGCLLACAEKYNFAAVNQPLVRRRIHPGQMINTLKQEAERLIKEADMAYLRERYGCTGGVWVPS